jgi:predicted MPP superfamily phosphohydrolase
MLAAALPLSASLVVLLKAARRYGSRRAVFLGVLFAILLVPGVVLQARAAALPSPLLRHAATGLSTWGMVSFFAMIGALLFAPRLRRWPWTAAIAIPGSVWAAGTFFAIPWVAASTIARAFVHVPPFAWAFYAVALTGVWTSLAWRREIVRIRVGEDAGAELTRAPVVRERVRDLTPAAGRPLRLLQITDPHLGPFRSEASLRALCERAVAADPDLVLLTGDFFTREGAGSPDALTRALQPLVALTGRTFACLGNHDHENPREVRDALRAAGVTLLVDDVARVETRAGTVQIVGLDHRWGDRTVHAAVLRRVPRVRGALRLVLLHDPGAFARLPDGEADLVLSGHTHGGHVGLVSLGSDWTAVSAIAGIPDHGLWARGRDRLYVHRGSGHYGFPLRIGVPLEESILEVERAVPER